MPTKPCREQTLVGNRPLPRGEHVSDRSSNRSVEQEHEVVTAQVDRFGPPGTTKGVGVITQPLSIWEPDGHVDHGFGQ
jgi:hypothetical protein